MKNEENNVLTIKLFDYRLTETNLDALASEFMGKVLSNFSASTGEIGIEFGDEVEMTEFKAALKCFKIDFGEKK